MCPRWIGKSCWDEQCFWKHLCPFEMKSRKKPHSSFQQSLVPQNGHTFIALVPESLPFQSSWHLPLCCSGQCPGQRKTGSSTGCCGGSLFGPRPIIVLVMAPTEHILAWGYSQSTPNLTHLHFLFLCLSFLPYVVNYPTLLTRTHTPWV